MSENNSVTAELVTTLTLSVLIEGRGIIPEIFINDDIVKGILIGGTHVVPRSVHALNETTFLVTYLLGVSATTLVLPLKKSMNGSVSL